MEYRFVSLETWPGERTRYPGRSKFRAGHNDTLELLDRELRHLAAKNVVIQADCDKSQIRMDGMLYSGARLRTGGVILTFDSKLGPLSYPCDKYSDWHDNLRAIALSLEALRAVDRYGVTRRAEQYKGWTRLPAPAEANGFATLEDAARFLCETFLGPSPAFAEDTVAKLLSDVEEFRLCYRGAAQILHPDRNSGDDTKFKRLQKAKIMLEKHHGL
jgi:hypothetical protein